MLLRARVGLGMAGTRPQFPPPATMQQAIDIAEGNPALQAFLQLTTELLGGQHAALRRSGLPLPEEGLFLLLTQVGPAPAAPALSLEPFRAVLVILCNPQPYGLFRSAQELGHLVGRQPADVGQPDGQTSLVAGLVGRLTHPGLQIFGIEPGLNLSRGTHRIPPAPMI